MVGKIEVDDHKGHLGYTGACKSSLDQQLRQEYTYGMQFSPVCPHMKPDDLFPSLFLDPFNMPPRVFQRPLTRTFLDNGESVSDKCRRTYQTYVRPGTSRDMQYS